MDWLREQWDHDDASLTNDVLLFDFPGVAEQISNAVQEFATKRGVQCQLLPQDEPFWYIAEEKEEEKHRVFMRVVQICACLPAGSGLQLVVTVFPQEVNNLTGAGRGPADPQEVASLPLTRDLMQDKITETLLEPAWRKAQALTKDHLSSEIFAGRPRPDWWPS